MQLSPHLHCDFPGLGGIPSRIGRQVGKVLRQLPIRVLAVPGGKVQALPVVGQPAIVYRGSHIVHLCLFLEPLDEGQEELTLQAALIQIIWMPVLQSSFLEVRTRGRLPSCSAAEKNIAVSQEAKSFMKHIWNALIGMLSD